MLYFCYYGVLASESFEQMADSLFESNWLELPVELQKYFVIMIANMQNPLFYNGFGVFDVNLTSFISVSLFSSPWNILDFNMNVKIYQF